MLTEEQITSEFVDIIRTYDDDFLRMKHNNGDPIYVCFDKEYSEDLKEQAKKSLDYIFGIAGKINNHYHYEIVNKFEFDLICVIIITAFNVIKLLNN